MQYSLSAWVTICEDNNNYYYYASTTSDLYSHQINQPLLRKIQKCDDHYQITLMENFGQLQITCSTPNTYPKEGTNNTGVKLLLVMAILLQQIIFYFFFIIQGNC